jgi:hypothetical protein
VTSLGQHRVLGQRHGKRSQLFVDDAIVATYAPRYSPDQFEANVPTDLGPCDLAAGGAIAAHVVSAHSRMATPTRLEPIGLLLDEQGAVINLRGLALPTVPAAASRPPTIAVAGTSMNAGKTTVAAALVCGLTRAGFRVGAAKVTGTGAPADPTMFADAGAACVLDFTDVGYASTYQVGISDILRVSRDLVDQLSARDVDVIVLEIADGVLQQETAALLDTETFRANVDGVVFAAVDSIGAIGGARMMTDLGYRVLALSGVVTAAPLAVGEVSRHVDLPVHLSADFRSPAVALAVTAPLVDRSAVLDVPTPRVLESAAVMDAMV